MRKIAYLGPEKTNTHLAAMARFGRRAKYEHAPTVDEVFHQVERRRADYGVVPVENSLEGAVTRTLDRFFDFVDTPIHIHGEIEQPIRHSLILHAKRRLPDILVVFSHPQALAQCSEWLDKHVSHAQRWEVSSTAEAIERLHQPKPTVRIKGKQLQGSVWSPDTCAAIARPELADGKKLIALPIPEDRDNKTRFLVIGFNKPARGARNKTSILFALKDKPGALHDALVPFKSQRINLTKIESRPSKRKAWEYVFFIDFDGHESEPRVQRALKALEASTTLLRILGSYPIAS